MGSWQLSDLTTGYVHDDELELFVRELTDDARVTRYRDLLKRESSDTAYELLELLNCARLVAIALDLDPDLHAASTAAVT